MANVFHTGNVQWCSGILKMPMLFFAGCIGDMCKVSNERGKSEAWKGFVSRHRDSKQKFLSPKQSVEFKC